MSRQVSTKGHLPGRTVSDYTYKKYGCRCDGCRALATQAQRVIRARNGNSPAQRAQHRANNAAVRWVRDHHPDVWKRLYDEAYLNEVTS